MNVDQLVSSDGSRARLRTFVCAVIAMAVSSLACSGGGGPPKIAARVEGISIPSSEIKSLLDDYLRSNAAQQPDEEVLDDVARSALLHQIRVTFLEHLAAEMSGTSADPGSKDERFPETLLEKPSDSKLRPMEVSMARSFQAGRLNEAMAQILFPDVTVSEAELEAEYERLRLTYDHKSFWRARANIATFTSEDRARQLASRVEQGEPFARAAAGAEALHTEGVDVTPISPLPLPVLDAIGTLPTNNVSSPIHADVRGWVVVLVERREPLPEFSIDDVRGDLTRFLADRKRQSLFQDWFEKKLQKARVEVSEHYGRWDSDEARVI